MFHAAPGMHHEIARQHQQTLLDDARSVRQTERGPHRTGVRVTIVALIACLGVGGIGLSQAKAANNSRSASQTATRTRAHVSHRPASRMTYGLIGGAASKRAALHSRPAPLVVVSRAL